MTKGIKGLLKTPIGDYTFNFLFIGLFMSIMMGLYDHYLNKPFEIRAVLFRFIIFGLLGIFIRPTEKSVDEKKAKEKSDNSNN